ncbi:MAG TPA: carboxypeptidase-like regulatory domain-containing protein, partial [Terriglobia bacterium]|nr:carboxypeptidase-like regulatory domain-containing protein [Terriglobia bacterium]
MHTLGRLILLIVLIPIFGLGQQLTTSIETQLTGTVADDVTGEPISGAVLRGPVTATGIPILVRPSTGNPLDNFNQRRPTALSDDRGRFLLSDFGEGTRYVLVEHDGYNPRIIPVTLTARQSAADIMIRMTRSAVITGRVLDVSGCPAPNVVITPLSYEDQQGTRKLVFGKATSTDDRGEFRLTVFTPQTYAISITPGRCQTPLLPMIGGGANPGGMSCRTNVLPVDSEPAPRFTPMFYPGVSNLASTEWIEIKSREEIRLRDTTLNSARLGEVRVHIINGKDEPAQDVDYYFVPSTQLGLLSGGATSIRGVVSSGVGNQAVHLEKGGEFVKIYHPNLPGAFEAQVRWGDGVDEIQPSIPLPGVSSTTRYIGLRGDRARIVQPIEFTGADLDVEIVVGKPQGSLKVHVLDEHADGTVSDLAGVIVYLCERSRICNVNGQTQAQTHLNGTAEFKNIHPGPYDFVFSAGVPPSRYIADVRQGDRNVGSEGIDASIGSSAVEIRYKSDSGSIGGSVADNDGNKLQNALVLLEPESSSKA